MHRCLVDCPAVEIEVELFRKRDVSNQERRTETETSRRYRFKSKKSRQGEYNGLKQGVEFLSTQENVKYVQNEGKNDSIASSRTKLAFTEDLLVE
jgi:hypothetical protein